MSVKLVPGSRFLVPGSRYQVPVPWLLVPGFRFPGYRFSVFYKYKLLQYIPSRIHYLQANNVYLLVSLLALHDEEICKTLNRQNPKY